MALILIQRLVFRKNLFKYSSRRNYCSSAGPAKPIISNKTAELKVEEKDVLSKTTVAKLPDLPPRMPKLPDSRKTPEGRIRELERRLERDRERNEERNRGISSRNKSSFSIEITKTHPKYWLPHTLALISLFGIYEYFKYSLFKAQENPDKVANKFEVAWYRFLPLRTLSRLWGWMHGLELPELLREPVLSTYAEIFHCNMEEAQEENYSAYKNLGEFFRRPLKKDARPIDQSSFIVSPSDGRILYFGEVKCAEIEQVKGVTYSLQDFLGPPTWIDVKSDKYKNSDKHKGIDPSDPALMLTANCDKYQELVKQNPPETTRLYQIVIYLAPGDYHRFHSPTNWTINFRRHFSGDLMSVSPKIANFIRGLFSLNERAVYVGDWKHGFFAMVPVGATNVGSIKIYCDEELHTNKWDIKKGVHFDKTFPSPLEFKKGDPFGEFNLGSTIVLIFEGPPNFKFPIWPDQVVRVGEKIIMSKKPKSKETSDNKTGGTSAS